MLDSVAIGVPRKGQLSAADLALLVSEETGTPKVTEAKNGAIAKAAKATTR